MEKILRFNKNMLAYCGIYCEQCSYKLAHDENNVKHLTGISYSATFKDVSEYNCEGCKGYCICGVCKIKPCAKAKDIDSCADCGGFPCHHITAFENDGIPHHKTAVENLKYIKKHGLEKWFDKLKPSLQCEKCGARQSWYYICEE